MMQAHFLRRLPRLRPANHPDRLAHQLEQWRKAEQKQQAFAQRATLNEFTDNYGLGISHD